MLMRIPDKFLFDRQVKAILFYKNIFKKLRYLLLKNRRDVDCSYETEGPTIILFLCVFDNFVGLLRDSGRFISVVRRRFINYCADLARFPVWDCFDFIVLTSFIRLVNKYMRMYFTRLFMKKFPG